MNVNGISFWGVQRAPITPVLFSAKKAPVTPVVKDHYNVVIVGGGLSGMTAAYHAQKNGLDTLLLEETDRLGGNAKTGWRTSKNKKKMPFPVGASVLAVANDKQRKFFNELGINTFDPKYKIHTDVTYFDGKWVTIDPSGKTKDPMAKNDTKWSKEFAKQTQNFIQYLYNILRPREGATHFPLQKAPPEIFKWDKIDLATFLDMAPPKVKEFFTVNLRSDISEDMHRISALAGIIDQGADMGERVVLPGGNFFLINTMRKKIESDAASAKTPVTVTQNNTVVKVEEGPDFATVTYKNQDGTERKVTAKHVLLGMPSHKVPNVVTLPAEKADFLRSIKRGSYAMLNIYLDSSPVQSHTYYKFPYAKWVADVILNNEKGDPDLKPGSKVPGVLTCYIGITSDMKKEAGGLPSGDAITKNVIEEMSVAWPWLKKEMKGSRITVYPEAMSAPAPGQMEKIRDFDPQLSPHIRSIHSDLSGVFAARGAIDQAMNAIEAITTNKSVNTIS